MEESEARIDSNNSEGRDEPSTVWERLLVLLFTYNLRTNLMIWLTFVMIALVLGFLLMILRF